MDYEPNILEKAVIYITYAVCGLSFIAACYIIPNYPVGAGI